MRALLTSAIDRGHTDAPHGFHGAVLLAWVLVGSGLLYGGIGVLWLVVLGQRWLHRRTLVRAERSAPASSRQRIIEPRTDRRTRSGTVVAMTAVAERGSARAAARTGGSPSAEPVPAVAVFEGIAAAARRSRAVRRRRRILLALLVLTAVAEALAVLGRVPWWAPVAAAAVAVCWFVSGASFARAGRRARRGHRRRMRNRELARAVPEMPQARPVRPVRPVEPSWDSVPSVEVVARWGREKSDTDGLDRRELEAAGLGAAGAEPTVVTPGAEVHSADAPDNAEAPHGPGAPVPDPGSWQPVPVPLPSYLTAPRVPRTVARIDFGVSGSWTSAVPNSLIAADGVGGGHGPVQLGRSGLGGASAPRPEPRPRRAAAEPRVEVEATNTAGAGVEEEQTTEVPYELPRAVGD